jgi:hypothetical protein
MRCLTDGSKESNNTKDTNNDTDSNTINNDSNDKNNNNNHEIKFEKIHNENVQNSTKIIDKIIDDDNIIVQTIELFVSLLFVIIVIYIISFLLRCYYLQRTRHYIIIT